MGVSELPLLLSLVFICFPLHRIGFDHRLESFPFRAHTAHERSSK